MTPGGRRLEGPSEDHLLHGPPTGPAVPCAPMDLTRRTLVKVPEITALFWITKLLTTAMGESTSDYLVNAVSPVLPNQLCRHHISCAPMANIAATAGASDKQ